MKIIIVDNNEKQREENTECLHEIYPYAKINAYEDPDDAFEELKQEETDLIMLKTALATNGVLFRAVLIYSLLLGCFHGYVWPRE